MTTCPSRCSCWVAEPDFESTDFEDAVRHAVSLGDDTDTSDATSAIAERFYGEVPPEIVKEVRWHLDAPCSKSS